MTKFCVFVSRILEYRLVHHLEFFDGRALIASDMAEFHISGTFRFLDSAEQCILSPFIPLWNSTALTLPFHWDPIRTYAIETLTFLRPDSNLMRHALHPPMGQVLISAVGELARWLSRAKRSFCCVPSEWNLSLTEGPLPNKAP